MVFASLEFLTLFFPLFLIVYALVGKGQKNFTLMLASWIFYGWWSPMFLSLLVGITIWVWAGGILIERASSAWARGWLLGGAIVVMLLISVITNTSTFWLKPSTACWATVG